MKGKDHTGLTYGDFTVIGEAPKHIVTPHRRVFVRCKCGVEQDVNLPSLVAGRTINCGCTRGERSKAPWDVGRREPAPIVTHADFEEVIRYAPSTGEFFWKTRPEKFFSSDKACEVWNAQWAGQAVGAYDVKGYRVTTFQGKLIRLHRLAYFLIHGEWPEVSIDHINGVKDDNRWVNLRHASRSENQRNQKRPTTNTSGHKGVIFDKTKSTWYFQMRQNDGSRFTKSGFKTKEDAAEACRAMREKLHGQFANHG